MVHPLSLRLPLFFLISKRTHPDPRSVWCGYQPTVVKLRQLSERTVRSGPGRPRPAWMGTSPHKELGPRGRGPGRRRRPGGPRFGEVPFPLLHGSRSRELARGKPPPSLQQGTTCGGLADFGGTTPVRPFRTSPPAGARSAPARIWGVATLVKGKS